MYRTVIVDDEMPALRYIRSIIEKYAPEFSVEGVFSGAAKALEYLEEHPIDLLITDVHMHGMNGIELATRARKLDPQLHIIILSGYAEFEYAKGAIQAAVDEYLLKPVSIPEMTGLLGRIAQKLQTENDEHVSLLLTSLASGIPCPRKEVDKYLGNATYRFTLVRFGNPDPRLKLPLTNTALLPQTNPNFIILRGRDDNEQILLSTHTNSSTYLADLGVYMAQQRSNAVWTVIYSLSLQHPRYLPEFIREASSMISIYAIIGKTQMLPLSKNMPAIPTPSLPAAEIKQLTYFVTSGKTRQIKEYLLDMATQWERQQMPISYAWPMLRMIANQLSTAQPSLCVRLDAVLSETYEVMQVASSYGDLLMSFYTILFDDNNPRDKKMTAEELYNHVIAYIDAQYAQQLNMQSVCDEMGISRTYLSRLIRKYGDTTFNAYLTHRRIEASMALLQEHPEYKLRDIAACVGYDDPSYWGKVFHQSTGLTPSQYISKIGAENTAE